MTYICVRFGSWKEGQGHSYWVVAANVWTSEGESSYSGQIPHSIAQPTALWQLHWFPSFLNFG